MPLRQYDPFQNKIERLDARVNPYVAQMALASLNSEEGLPLLYGPQLRDKAGHWREILPFQTLICEVGVHKGATIIEMAKEHPDIGFVGLDITFKRVVTTAQRVKEAGLKNVCLVLANASAIDLLFGAEELQGLVLFFPDPWIRKKRQAKNRLVTPSFGEKVANILTPKGFFWFKTDHEPYFLSTQEIAKTFGFKAFSNLDQFILSRDYSSVFEQRFQDQGSPTYAARWVKME